MGVPNAVPGAFSAAQDQIALELAAGRPGTVRLHRVLGIVAKALDLSFGAVWRPGPDTGELRCAAVWHESAPDFAVATLEQRFAKGRGLPGYVWATGTPAWVPSVVWDPRVTETIPGVQSAVAVPIGTGEAFAGVLELFSADKRDRDAETLRFLGAVAAQLAATFSGWGAQDRLATPERTLTAADTAVAVADATQPGFPLVYVNPAFERLTGYRAEELLGRSGDRLLGPGSDPEAAARLSAAIAAGAHASETILTFAKDGVPFFSEITVAPVADDAGRVAQVIATIADVTDRQIADEEAAFVATHDPVTGVANAARLRSSLDRVVARAGRHGLQVALVAFELEGVEAVAGEHGAEAAQELLCRAAERLQASVRGGDLVARGGDHHFAVVMADLEPEDAADCALDLATRVHAALQRPFALSAGPVGVGVSAGVSILGRDEGTPDELLRRAGGGLGEAREHAER